MAKVRRREIPGADSLMGVVTGKSIYNPGWQGQRTGGGRSSRRQFLPPPPGGRKNHMCEVTCGANINLFLMAACQASGRMGLVMKMGRPGGADFRSTVP